MALKTYKPSQQTKANILQKAMELFNEKGTAAISMNSLAQALGISAGNLQYHYRSKNEVIRAILEDLFRQFDRIYPSTEEPLTMDVLRPMMRHTIDLVWKYRFFYRESPALLRNDQTLALRFREIEEIRLTQQEAIFKCLAAAGRVQIALPPDELRNVVQMGWVLVHTWLPYVESTGQEIDEAALEHAVDVMVQFYKPYIGV